MVVRIERVDITGLPQAIAFLQHVVDELERPTEALEKSTKAVAEQWHKNFDAEGGEYRRWRSLSGRTVAERARLGYGAEHPILRRDGSLLSTAIEFFERANGGSGSATGDGIRADYTIAGNEAVLHMSGRKALNQSGGGRLPARPFWYSEGRAALAARAATEAWLREKFG